MMGTMAAEGGDKEEFPNTRADSANGEHQKIISETDNTEHTGARVQEGGEEHVEEKTQGGDNGDDGNNINPSGSIPMQENISNERLDVVEEDEEEQEEEEEEQQEQEQEEESAVDHPALFRNLAERLAKEPIKVRVHDLKIKGNTKTKEWVIESMLEELKHVETLQDLLREAATANVQIQNLGIFEKCAVTLDAGPRELPGTANVSVELEELKRPFSCDVGMYTKSDAKHGTLEGRVRWKNVLGNAETWDGTGCYGLDTTSEVSFGVHFPRVKGWPAAFLARASVLTQDWHKYSSYKERLSGFSLGLVNRERHEFYYNLTWRDLKDPSHRASREIRKHLGHDLLSSIKYTYKIDKRDSVLRPTSGYAVSSTTQVAGIGPDNRISRFARQEFVCKLAIPLGLYNAALNFGVAAGVILPLGRDFLKLSTPVSDRFFMGGYSSLVGDLRATALLGFRTRGVGPTSPRRFVPETDATDSKTINGVSRDALGGDLALAGFTDLSFDLPLRFLREHDIHGHCFACTGNLIGLTGEKRQPFSLRDFISSFRCSVGAGIVIPSKLFRFEVNYCHVLRHQEYDRVKRGFQFCISSAQ